MLTPEQKLQAEFLGLENPTTQKLEAALRSAGRSKAPKFKTDSKKRYRLHKKVKRYVYLYPGKRLMLTDDPEFAGVPEKDRAAIFELRDAYGYTIQQVLKHAIQE
jgi:hypothetical protein